MAEERTVVLSRSDNNHGFGFSLLGDADLPHIIYEIEEDSPAARSGQVESGDVLLKVNETDVNRFTTREVLKCLRLSSDPVTLKLKRDPHIKASVRRYISATSTGQNASSNRRNHDRQFSSSSTTHSSGSSNGLESLHSGTGSSSEALLNRLNNEEEKLQKPPKFEAYMMTGELMLNLSRVERSQLHPHHQHHVPRHRNYYRYNSTPASPIESRIPSTNSEPTQRYHSSPPESQLYNNVHETNSACEFKRCANNEDSLLNIRPHSAVRTSRSEDHLQKEWSLSTVDVALEEDLTSSLNTLLDTRDSDKTPPTDRIVWTYNAPVSSAWEQNCNGSSHTSNSTSISDSISHRSISPASPPSKSSSAVSSKLSHQQHLNKMNGDRSLSEAISNISSPDYQEQPDMSEAGRDLKMELSDHSDSDSTILASEQRDYKLVIQVKGPEKQINENDIPIIRNNSLRTKTLVSNGSIDNRPENPESFGYQELKTTCSNDNNDSDEETESDGESLHEHYNPKSVDMPSAIRLASRLYNLQGFKRSDVCKNLSRNNDFTKAVADEYLSYFDFSGLALDEALRVFLTNMALNGETQERERVLAHFAKRYLDNNPGTFPSNDAAHTLTCALMLLNTDLHGEHNTSYVRMTCGEFIHNLSGLNDGGNYQKEQLKMLFQSIRNKPLMWAVDEQAPIQQAPVRPNISATPVVGPNMFLSEPDNTNAITYKKGYVMRKSCYDSNGKRTPFGKRGWKMFYATLKDMVLYLHKNEHGFKQTGDGMHNAIRLHHALATVADDYVKKNHVFRLKTADQAEYLFQTSDTVELQSWIDSINTVCALYSSPALPPAVGPHAKLQRPLLPSAKSRLSLEEQLIEHEKCVSRLENELESIKGPYAREREAYTMFEINRYRTYVQALREKEKQDSITDTK